MSYNHAPSQIIAPKFADDMVAIAVSEDVGQIEESLQSATNKLLQWAANEGMELNAQKTKVMLFGDTVNKVTVKMNDFVLDCVSSFKYLGVVIDTKMDFSMQVDYAALKAKRAMAKVSTLIDGREFLYILELIYTKPWFALIWNMQFQ